MESGERAAYERLASRHVILIGGKGGVGKTTISSRAATFFAESRPTILFTTDPASNLDDVFASPVANLTIESVDADGSIHTVEGNSSDRVSQRTYGSDGGGAVGYVRLG